MTDPVEPDTARTDPADEIRSFMSRANEGFGAALGLTYGELTADRVTAELPLGPHLHQPGGIVHGGVYCAVIEGLASTGGAIWYAGRGHVVGVNNNTDFLRATREGVLACEALPVHRGRTQQLWVVTLVDKDERLIARGQVRLQNIADTAAIGR